MAKTLREQFIAGLLAMGETEVKRTSKYIVFTRKVIGPITNKFYYVGSHGALRVGTTTANSIPAATHIREMILAEAKKEMSNAKID